MSPTLAEKTTVAPDLTSGRLLARNTILNLIGQIAPVLVAVVAIPLLIRKMGTDRFGVLTLAWLLIGYFSLFDFGIGRALTQLVARRQVEDPKSLPALIQTGLFLMLGFSLIGAMLIAGLAPWLVKSVLNVSAELHAETLASFYLMAAALPIVITTTGLRGVLEARQLFGEVNAGRILLGVSTYLSPLLALLYWQSLTAVILALIISRVLTWLLYGLFCLRAIPELRSGLHLETSAIRPLLNFGGWMTVTNIVGPLMVYLDRFLIGAFVSVTAVAYYSTPFELATKLWLIPDAIAGVLFPAFATSLTQGQQVKLLFIKGVKYLYLAVFPVTLLVIAYSREGLGFWIGEEFAVNGYRVMQLLMAGVFINSLGRIPFALIQSAGRPDWIAKLHLLELPFSLLLLYWLTTQSGIEGAAAAWVIRAMIDTGVLMVLASGVTGGILITGRVIAVIGASGLSLITVALINETSGKSIILGAWLAVFGVISWFLIISPQERQKALKWIQSFQISQ